MQAIEILTDIHLNKLLLDSYKMEIHFWDNMIEKINSIGGFTSSGAKMTVFRDSLIKDTESLIGETKSIIDLVKGLTDTRQKEVIVGRYFQGKTMKVIASDIGFSLMQTNRIHTAALEQLDLVLKNEGAAS